MEPQAFFAGSRLLIVAGKGGVGKTTVTAVVAHAAATCGLSVLVLAVDAGTNLGTLLGADAPLDDTEVTVATGLGEAGTGSIRARAVTAPAALGEYLDHHGLSRLLGRLVRTGVLDVVATAAPGIDDLLVLGKVKSLERAAVADLVLVDAPAAGHAITFLRSPWGLADVVSGGPIATQAQEVLAMLGDEARCRVMLVTLAEETPVNEIVDAAYQLEDQVGVALAPVVVNAVYPTIAGLAPAVPAGAASRGVAAPVRRALAEAAAFRCARVDQQHAQTARLAERLPLPQVVLPFRFTAGLDAADVRALAADLLAGIGRLG